MGLHEVFPYPTVKQVIFQVKFPNLFYLESKIGELQLKVMREFPEAELSHRRSVLFADLPPGSSPMDVPEKAKGEPWAKVWMFKSPNNYQMNILSNSLDITTQRHTTYGTGEVDGFRGIIELAVGNFLGVVTLPMFTRIGLRYINECPMPDEKTNEAFKKYYNSAFPLDRFNLSDAKEMGTMALVKKDKHSMRYQERLQIKDDERKLILDFDCFAENVPAADYLSVTDELHRIISSEYHSVIKEPVKDYMRHGGEKS